MRFKMIVILLLMCNFIVIGSTYQQCNIICGDDHIPSSSPSGDRIRGKAGPKGEKGEAADACECPPLVDMRGEMARMKIELEHLQRLPRDCYEIKKTYPMFPSGMYRIFPSFDIKNGLQVYCDMDTDGGGWIVFQNRQDGSVDFYRNWADYIQGFGELTGEFWLGLELVHKLTRNGTFDLRVDLTDFEQNSAYAQYSSFSISEGIDYRLDFNEYTGTAGSALEKTKFTTKDMDQDTRTGSNCAVTYKGAWWYGSCHYTNLNGLYLEGETEQVATGMVWYQWKGYRYSLKTSQMKFRPINV